MIFDKRPSVHENADSRTDGLFFGTFYQVLRSVGTRNNRSVHPRCFCGNESGNLYSLKRGGIIEGYVKGVTAGNM